MLSCKHVIIRPRPSLRPDLIERAGRGLALCRAAEAATGPEGRKEGSEQEQCQIVR